MGECFVVENQYSCFQGNKIVAGDGDTFGYCAKRISDDTDLLLNKQNIVQTRFDNYEVQKVNNREGTILHIVDQCLERPLHFSLVEVLNTFHVENHQDSLSCPPTPSMSRVLSPVFEFQVSIFIT